MKYYSAIKGMNYWSMQQPGWMNLQETGLSKKLSHSERLHTIWFHLYHVWGGLEILFIFREQGREEERETSVCGGCLLCSSNWGPSTQACMLDWESNWKPFGSQARAQSTELHQPGLYHIFEMVTFLRWRAVSRREVGMVIKRHLCAFGTFGILIVVVDRQTHTH